MGKAGTGRVALNYVDIKVSDHVQGRGALSRRFSKDFAAPGRRRARVRVEAPFAVSRPNAG